LATTLPALVVVKFC